MDRDSLFTSSVDCEDLQMDMEIIVDGNEHFSLFEGLEDMQFEWTKDQQGDNQRSKLMALSASEDGSSVSDDVSLSSSSSSSNCSPSSGKRKASESDEEAESLAPLVLPSAASPTVTVSRSVQLTCTLSQYDDYMRDLQKSRSLSKQQLSELRAQRKKVRNREYAKNKRATKKTKEMSQKDRLAGMLQENEQLKCRVAVLEKENASLRAQLLKQPPFSLFIVLFAVGLSFTFIGLPTLNTTTASELISTGRALLWNWDATSTAKSIATSCADAVNVTACIETLTKAVL